VGKDLNATAVEPTEKRASASQIHFSGKCVYQELFVNSSQNS